jgi:hypothetical protein
VLDTTGILHWAPSGVEGWRAFHLLADCSCVFKRGYSAPIEYGLVNWTEFEVIDSDTLYDLGSHYSPSVIDYGADSLLFYSGWGVDTLYLVAPIRQVR